MGILSTLSLEEIRQRGSIRDGDVLRLRAAYEDAACLSAEDAEALFAVHAATPIQDPRWSSLFVEAISDYIVNHAAPAGYVVAENARWLREQVSTFGRIETSTELSLLVHVLEVARWTPPTLAAFALEQIRHAIETSEGPLRTGRDLPKGAITPDEVALAARIVRAFGGETTISVTRAEADALIAINRAIAPGNSTPAWSSLLVRTIGSAVLAATGHSVACRRDIVEGAASGTLPNDLADLFLRTGSPVPSSLPRELRPAGLRVWRTARILSSEELALARLERQRLEIVTNEVIEEATDAWLVERLGETLEGDANETAILTYVMREAARPTSALIQCAARVAVAA